MREKFDSIKYPWIFWSTSIEFLHWTIVTTIWEWCSIFVFSASFFSELNENVRFNIIFWFQGGKSLLVTSVFKLGSIRGWPECSIISSSGEQNWIFPHYLSQIIWHPCIWRWRWAKRSTDTWMLGDCKLDWTQSVRGHDRVGSSHTVTSNDNIIFINHSIER